MNRAHPWRELADGVFVRRYPFYDQTIGAIVGSDGVAVVDTRTTLEHADELLRDLRALTTRPVRAVINTHHHYDHTFGNERFRPAPIWGHVRCAEELRERGDAHRDRVVRDSPELGEALRAITITPPDQTFSDRATLEIGDLRVELRYLGLGHTAGDIVALVAPREAGGDGVLFAGDLLENGAAPWFGEGYPVAWAETGKRLLGLIDGIVVPGHGDPAGHDFAARQVAEIGELARLASALVAGEVSLDDAATNGPFPESTMREALGRTILELGEGGTPGHESTD